MTGSKTKPKRMKSRPNKAKPEESNQVTVTETKTASKFFAATTSSQQSVSAKGKGDKPSNTCVACKENHPLWRCPAFRGKTPTERAKLVADKKLCFSSFNQNHMFRQCPQPRKCTKDGCRSSHNTFLQGADKIFTKKVTNANKDRTETSVCIGTSMNNERSDESSCKPSVADVKGLLQLTEVELHANGKSEKVLALCDSACSHSWISANLATKLNVHGTPTKLTVQGIISNQVVDTHLVELKLIPVPSSGSCFPFVVKPYVREDLKVGIDTIDVELLKIKYPHLQLISLKKYSYADVEMILGQDVFPSIRPL